MIRQQRGLLLALPAVASALAVFLVASSAFSQTASPTPTPPSTPTSTPTAAPTLSPPPTPSPISSVSATELAAQRAKWNAAAIVSYRYALGVYCFCPYDNPYTVTVRNGVTESMVDAHGQPVTYSGLTKLATIEALFEQVEFLTASTNYQEEVSYDPKYGFPSRMFWEASWLMTDDTMAIEVSDFTVLQPESLPRTGGPR